MVGMLDLEFKIFVGFWIDQLDTKKKKNLNIPYNVRLIGVSTHEVLMNSWKQSFNSINFSDTLI